MSIRDKSNGLQLIDQYCDDSAFRKGLSKNTLSAYKSDLTIYYKWTQKNNLSFLNIDRISINNYLAVKLEDGFSVGTIQRIITCIKNFYLFLDELNIIDTNPAELIENPKEENYQLFSQKLR